VISGIFVLDVDPSGGGWESLATLVQEHDPLPETYTVTTGSGGQHYYFLMPDFDVRNSAGKLGPGLDTRGDGGQVVAPPSVSAKGRYTVEHEAQVAAAPDWLLDLLRPPQRVPRQTSGRGSSSDGADRYIAGGVRLELERLDRMTTDAVPTWPHGYSGEAWDLGTFEVACNLIELANSAAGYSLEDAHRDLLEHAPEDHGFRERRHEAKWESARRTVGWQAREIPERDDDYPTYDRASARERAQQATPTFGPDGKPVFDFSEHHRDGAEEPAEPLDDDGWASKTCATYQVARDMWWDSYSGMPRDEWLLKLAIWLTASERYGCVTSEDFDSGVLVMSGRHFDPKTTEEDVTSALKQAEAEVADWTAEQLGTEVFNHSHEPKAKTNTIRDRLPILDWHLLWEDESEEEWIVEPLLSARRQVTIYSAPKAGKSLLALEIAVAIARGTRVLGTDTERPRRVLYVDFENDPRGDVKDRLQSMGLGPDDLGGLCYLSFPTLAALDSERGGAELLEVIAEYECEVVIVDTISRAVKGEENENDTWLDFYRYTGLRLKQAQVTLLRLDHTGKDENRGQRGGSAKSGDPDAVWWLTKISDTTVQLECTYHRMQVPEQHLLLHRESLPHLWHRVDAAGRSTARNLRVQTVVDALDRAGLSPDAGERAARSSLKVTGVKARNDVLREALTVRQGRV